jgi:periplasmic divalent cation tolerance protein
VESSGFVLVLTTLPAVADHMAFARTLVQERLAACVNVLPEMMSVYRWQDNIEQDRERQVLIKTTASRRDALEARIKELHKYEVPELLVLPISGGSSEYLAWLKESVGE